MWAWKWFHRVQLCPMQPHHCNWKWETTGLWVWSFLILKNKASFHRNLQIAEMVLEDFTSIPNVRMLWSMSAACWGSGGGTAAALEGSLLIFYNFLRVFPCVYMGESCFFDPVCFIFIHASQDHFIHLSCIQKQSIFEESRAEIINASRISIHFLPERRCKSAPGKHPLWTCAFSALKSFPHVH